LSWIRAALLFCATLVQQQPPPAPDPASEVARILVRESEPDVDHFSAAAAELAQVSGAFEPLLAALGSARAPDAEATTLGERQLALVLRALEGLGAARLAAFVAEEAREWHSVERSLAALRLLGARGRAGDVPALLTVGHRAEEHGAFGELEPVFEDALQAVLLRAPEAHGRLRERFGSLGPEVAGAAVRASERTQSRQALACVRALLGVRRELNAVVLQALANLSACVAVEQRGPLAEAVVPYLGSAERAEVLAAASALAHLGQAHTIPDLIEILAHEDPACVRAALAALRSIGGVSLPPSPQAWRSWYGREETWRQERAPQVLAALAHLDGKESVGELCAWLRELSEHSLHRDALVPRLTPLLRHPHARVRVLVCESLARLGSRAAIGPLVEALNDGSPDVVTAARAAWLALGGGPAPAPSAPPKPPALPPSG